MFDTKEIFETQHEEEDEDVEEVKAAAVVEPNQELLTSLKGKLAMMERHLRERTTSALAKNDLV